MHDPALHLFHLRQHELEQQAQHAALARRAARARRRSRDPDRATTSGQAGARRRPMRSYLLAAAIAVGLAGCGTATAPPQVVGVTVADGCLGGARELDRALVAAQEQAPLSGVGAASFTASLMRWAFAGPDPAHQATTTRQVLAARTSRAARSSLSGPHGVQWHLDFAGGKYVVESFETRGNGVGNAVVSWVAVGRPVDSHGPHAGLRLSGAVHLQAVDGRWRYQDMSSERSAQNVTRIGVPYAGGC